MSPQQVAEAIISAATVPPVPDWPQVCTSNSGRVYRVEPDDDGDPDDIPGSLVIGHEGEPVARPEPPEEDVPPRTDGMVEWTLWFQAGYPETTVLGPLDEPPISDALFYVDLALDEA